MRAAARRATDASTPVAATIFRNEFMPSLLASVAENWDYAGRPDGLASREGRIARCWTEC